jgi:hypothetical protein
MVVPTILGGLFDYAGATNLASATEKAGREAEAGAQRRFGQILGTANQADPFSTQSLTEEGGLEKTFTGSGAPSALRTRDIQTGTDVGGARRQQAALEGFKFDVPDYSTAQDLVQGDINLQREAFGTEADKLAIMRNRAGGGIGNTGVPGQYLGDLQEALAQLDFRKNINAMELMTGSQANQLANLQSYINVNKPLGPSAPGFDPISAATAVQTAGNVPLPQVPINQGDAAFPMAAGSVVRRLGEKQQTDALLEILRNRQLGNQGIVGV